MTTLAVHTSPEAGWPQGPSRPRLADGAVHVWRADLATASVTDLVDVLSDEERARARRFVNERDGELWQLSRCLLRVLLGRYVQREPASLRFLTGEHGKPELVREAEEPTTSVEQSSASASSVSFNMSHSGALVLYAFSSVGSVGVDVEVARRPIDEVAVAARMLGAEQARRLQALDPRSRRAQFLRAWTRHEAELKCLGVGIGGTRADAGAHSPWLAELDLGPDAAAAVAAERPAAELSCWEWSSSGTVSG
jgi:4'-phosphopantetheinyl transferase